MKREVARLKQRPEQPALMVHRRLRIGCWLAPFRECLAVGRMLRTTIMTTGATRETTAATENGTMLDRSGYEIAGLVSAKGRRYPLTKDRLPPVAATTLFGISDVGGEGRLWNLHYDEPV